MRNETPIELPRKAFELLTLLVENHGRLLTKEEIMERIRSDSFVEESRLPFTIGQFRRVLGNNARQRNGYFGKMPIKESVTVSAEPDSGGFI